MTGAPGPRARARPGRRPDRRRALATPTGASPCRSGPSTSGGRRASSARSPSWSPSTSATLVVVGAAALDGRQPTGRGPRTRARVRRRAPGGAAGPRRPPGRAPEHGRGRPGARATAGVRAPRPARRDRRRGRAGDPAGLARRARGPTRRPGAEHRAGILHPRWHDRAAAPDRPRPRRPSRRPRGRRPSFVVALVAFLRGRRRGRLGARPPTRTCRHAARRRAAPSTSWSPRAPPARTSSRCSREQGLTRCDGFVGNLLLRGTGAGERAARRARTTSTVGTSLEEIVAVLTHPARSRCRPIRLTVPEGLRIRSTYPGERSISSVVEEQLGPVGGAVRRPRRERAVTPCRRTCRRARRRPRGSCSPRPTSSWKKGLDERRGDPPRCWSSSTARRQDLPWGDAEDLGLTPYEVVIVASMIEREAQVDRGAAADRRRDLQPAAARAWRSGSTRPCCTTTRRPTASSRRPTSRPTRPTTRGSTPGCRRRRSRARARLARRGARTRGPAVPLLRAVSEGRGRRAPVRRDLRRAPRATCGSASGERVRRRRRAAATRIARRDRVAGRAQPLARRSTTRRSRRSASTWSTWRCPVAPGRRAGRRSRGSRRSGSPARTSRCRTRPRPPRSWTSAERRRRRACAR